ncbi:MAG: AAA family ATPase [Planctomycetes bacterium]|nr:AAA family ATPase [Planctomycetota bacterium]
MAPELELTRHGAARRALAVVGNPPLLEALEVGAARAAESFNLTPAEAALAGEIADLEPELAAGERRALFALVLAVRVFLARGSTRLPVPGEALERAVAELAAEVPALGAPAEVAAAIRRLLAERRAPAVVGAPGEYRPLVHDGVSVWSQRVLACEERLSVRLGAALARPPAVEDGAALDAAVSAACAALPLALSAEQAAAVRMALRAPVSLVTGGPGTGKTTVVAAVLLALRELGVPAEAVALAAPTGKAAWRLAEAVARVFDGTSLAADDPFRAIDARTLHRRLAYLPAAGRFRHHGNNPLPARVVIVDEASMIDVFLMERLLSAVREDGRLVLLGDADQLPSVDAGAVFRDLVAAGGAAARGVVRLEENFRVCAADPAGSALAAAAGAVNRGEVSWLAAADGIARRGSAAELRYEGVEALFAGAEVLRPFLAHWYETRIVDAAFQAAANRIYAVARGTIADEEERVAAARLLAHHERARVLCLTHGLRTGTVAANAALHRRHAQFLGRSADFDLVPGEPVVMLVNDYERGLFNGDTGVAVMGRDEDGRVQPHVVFRRGPELVALAFGPLRARLELAWAQTVHKSQGSEFDAVAVLLPERDLALLTRELVYTAITRARRAVVLVGPEARLRAGVVRRIERFSGAGGTAGGRLPRTSRSRPGESDSC